jgi:hypothetical protein
MPNSIKYSTTGDTLSLRKGNLYFGTGDVGKGPSSVTQHYNGVTPQSGTYMVYFYDPSQPNNIGYDPISSDVQLISYTNGISGQNFTGATQCFNWYATQTNYTCVNEDYDSIITNGLVLNLDAGFLPSYSTSGTTWYDLAYSGYNGTLTNGPTYSSLDGGSIVFDGVDDYMIRTDASLKNYTTVTANIWMYVTSSNAWETYFSYNAEEAGISQGWGVRRQSTNNIFQYWGGTGNSGIKLYQNGQLLNSANSTYSQVNATINNTWQMVTIVATGVSSWNTHNRLTIATRSDGLNSATGMKVGRFNLYNRELSAVEILQNYLSTINPKSIFGSSLKIWYDMSLLPSTVSVDNVNTIDSSNNLVTLSRVYDLSGNGKHLTQATKVSQPTFIPNSQNGKPANYNNGSSVGSYPVMYAPSPGLTTGARSFFIVLKGPSSSAFSWDRGGATRGSLQLGYAGGTGWNDLQQDTNFSIPGGNSTTTYVMSYMFDTNQSIFYRNGNLNRTQTTNTYTLNGNSFGCWWTAPSAGSQTGSWYEMVYLNKIPTIEEYNALVTYLGTKWGVSCGTLTNYN